MDKGFERQLQSLVDSGTSTKGLSVEDYARVLLKSNAPQIVECPNCHHKHIILSKQVKVRKGSRSIGSDRTNKKWDKEEVERMMAMDSEGKSHREIASALGRSSMAISVKLCGEKKKV